VAINQTDDYPGRGVPKLPGDVPPFVEKPTLVGESF